jgi:hypothetical protein
MEVLASELAEMMMGDESAVPAGGRQAICLRLKV